MAAILYTTTEAIRSLLGVTLFDIKDAQITERGLERELRLDLNEWLPTHATIYSEATAASPSASQQKKGDLLILYSMYFCALLLASATELWAPNSVSDGKNTMKRPVLALQALLVSLRAQVAKYKRALVEALGGSAELPLSQLIAVGDNVDPVISTGA